MEPRDPEPAAKLDLKLELALEPELELGPKDGIEARDDGLGGLGGLSDCADASTPPEPEPDPKPAKAERALSLRATGDGAAGRFCARAA